MSNFINLTSYSIKRNDVLLPDVYKQQTGQKEDEMSEANVRSGFTFCKPIKDEYDTCVNEMQTFENNSLWHLYYNIIMRQNSTCLAESSSLSNSNISKKITCPEINRTISSNFIKDLSSHVPLEAFLKKMPCLNLRREEILNDLLRYRPSINKVAWFIGRSNQLNSVSTLELSKRKPKTNSELPIDWGKRILEHLSKLLKVDKDQLKLTKYDFVYLSNVLLYLYDVNILDHWETLNWLFDTACTIYSPSVDSVIMFESSLENHKHLKLFLNLLLSFNRRITEIESITRKLLVWACLIVSKIFNQSSITINETRKRGVNSKEMTELLIYPTIRNLLYKLSTFIISLSVALPTACVWNRNSNVDAQMQGDDTPCFLLGSPLDYLPCGLIELPKPPSFESTLFQDQLFEVENEILERSRAAEMGWAQVHDSRICKILDLRIKILRILDQHDFMTAIIPNPIESLASKLLDQAGSSIDQLVKILCDWAITNFRAGIYRSAISACIIESISTISSSSNKERMHKYLAEYLSVHAPSIAESQCYQHSNVTYQGQFRSLVALFAELIDRGLFDYTAYMNLCTKNDCLVDISVINNFSGVDITDFNFISTHSRLIEESDNKHIQYLFHFPIPQDESFSSEINQRARFVYCSSRIREKARLELRKLIREICRRLMTRKYMIDVINGEIGKRKKTTKSIGSADDDNHDEIIFKFKQLSYHDMEFVISQCTSAYFRALSGSVDQSGSSNTLPLRYMPLPSVICMIFELMELSLNIGCLLELATDTLVYLRPLLDFKIATTNLYRSSICTRIVGIFRKHQAVLLTMNNLQAKIFHELPQQIIRSKSITSLSAIDRCMLLNLEDLVKASYRMKSLMNQFQLQKIFLFSELSLRVRNTRLENTELHYNPGMIPDLSCLSNESNLRSFVEELNIHFDLRYNFVIRSITSVCAASSIDKVVNICEICTFVTGQCESMSIEWLTAFKAFLAPPMYNASNSIHYYHELNSLVDLSDMSAYDNISTLIGTLLTYNIFNFTEFLKQIFNPALASQLSSNSMENNSQYNAKCACFVLHRLFSWSSGLDSKSNCYSDIHWTQARVSEPLLLYAAMNREPCNAPLVDAMKLLVIISSTVNEEESLIRPCIIDLENMIEEEDCLSDESLGESDVIFQQEDDENIFGRKKRKCTTSNPVMHNQTSSKKKRKKETQFSSKLGKRALPYRFMHAATKEFLDNGVLPSDNSLSTYTLPDLTQLLARQIATIEWVRLYFNSLSAEFLFTRNVLNDRHLVEQHARRVLHVMYWPRDWSWVDIATNESVTSAMISLLNNLNFWTIDYSSLEFRMLISHIQNMNQERSMEIVAQVITRKFQQQAVTWHFNGSEIDYSKFKTLVQFSQNHSAWLIPYIVSQFKLLKVHIAKQAIEVLKGVKTFPKLRNIDEKERVLINNSVILAHAPFFELLKICMCDCNEFVDSLNEQIDSFIQDFREVEDRVPENFKTKWIIQQCLALRIALIGNRMMFQIENEFATKWIPTLALLIIYGVCDERSNSPLFLSVIDMLNYLLHLIMERFGQSSKVLMTTLKKIRKEICDKPYTLGFEKLRCLLFSSKNAPYVYVYTVLPSTEHARKSSNSGIQTLRLKGSQENSAVGGGIRAYSHKHGYTIVRRDPCSLIDLYDISRLGYFYNIFRARLAAYTQPCLFQLVDLRRLVYHEHYSSMKRSFEFYLEPIFCDKLQQAFGDILVQEISPSESKTCRIATEEYKRTSINLEGHCSLSDIPLQSLPKLPKINNEIKSNKFQSIDPLANQSSKIMITSNRIEGSIDVINNSNLLRSLNLPSKATQGPIRPLSSTPNQKRKKTTAQNPRSKVKTVVFQNVNAFDASVNIPTDMYTFTGANSNSGGSLTGWTSKSEINNSADSNKITHTNMTGRALHDMLVQKKLRTSFNAQQQQITYLDESTREEISYVNMNGISNQIQIAPPRAHYSTTNFPISQYLETSSLNPVVVQHLDHEIYQQNVPDNQLLVFPQVSEPLPHSRM